GLDVAAGSEGADAERPADCSGGFAASTDENLGKISFQDLTGEDGEGGGDLDAQFRRRPAVGCAPLLRFGNGGGGGVCLHELRRAGGELPDDGWHGVHGVAFDEPADIEFRDDRALQREPCVLPGGRGRTTAGDDELSAAGGEMQVLPKSRG